jgi:hypothetical protein
MDRREEEEYVGNVGSEYENVSNECETEDGSCEDSGAETGEHSNNGEAE